MQSSTADQQETVTATLEAFADTIVPGEKRWTGDHAIAGASTGPGAVEAGALELLRTPATGVTEGLDSLADLLDAHARAYASEHGTALDESLSPFVGLAFEHRTELVRALLTPGHPEKEFWVMLALFSNMAFDSAAHLHTAEAVATGHPGLSAMGIAHPDADGLWRFSEHSYGRKLAEVHPDTTASGSPA
ncbi:hypothetical protein SAMN04487904_101459 [Actinopolyspora lacussalsi subsp. righensis]|uniref:Gluconate 2-dehydrogenase subunit 3 n=1 Tax=Actinopolyspora righensis TaxID=995060 RepID=A0A1I6XCC4_9ACTN|nr:DUF5987 family protein [Actinopolyspora righensis]SFT35965.1 hypothetical protein SAMN04487904_101459 [Actinopolyspora righensis]